MAKTSDVCFLEKYGAKLIKKDYPIVPIKRGSKSPSLWDWSNLNATEADLKRWLANGFSDGGVGVITKNTPAIDVDIRDYEVNAQVVRYIEKLLGTTVQRVGDAPKTLLVFRTDKPFPKVSSKKYSDFLGVEHHIEILCDGQQFVAFAVHPDTGKPYQWVSDKTLADVKPEELPELTLEIAISIVEWFESIVPDDWEVVSPGGVGKKIDYSLSDAERALMNVKPKVNISIERLKACLAELDADDYHIWVKVGMALFHQFDGEIQGLELWDEWSQPSDKYNPDEILGKWQTFKANIARQEPVTVATILRMARLADEQNQGDVIGSFLERYVYVEDGDRICDLNKPPHCCVSRLAEFRNRTANVRHEIPAPTAKDPNKTRLEAVWKSWMIQPKRKSAEGTVYSPKESRVITDDYGLDWINQFHMPELSITDQRDELDVFVKHMIYLFPKEDEREWFISWMAFNLQFPERRCKVTPLHVSVAHGTGRGWLVELMGKLLGQWNCKKTKMSVLSGEGNGGGFHDFLHNSLLCAIEEVKEGNKRFAVSDRIRDLLTENFLEVNIKHGSKKTQQVFTNFFFMTNHPDALVLTREDRRINVFSGPDVPKSRDYYDRLYRWLDTNGVNQLFSFLMQRDLSSFDWVRSMDTEARTRMIQNNRTETEVLFWELMEKPPYPAMTAKQIMNELRNRAEGDEFESNIEESQLNKLLQHHATGPIKIKVQGQMRRAWLLVKGKTLNNSEIREALTECGV